MRHPPEDVTAAMSRQFLLHTSDVAREAAARNIEIVVERVANLVLNVSSLADRMEAKPVTDLDEAVERRARVKVLRDAGHAGQEAIRRATAELTRDEDTEVLDKR